MLMVWMQMLRELLTCVVAVFFMLWMRKPHSKLLQVLVLWMQMLPVLLTSAVAVGGQRTQRTQKPTLYRQ